MPSLWQSIKLALRQGVMATPELDQQEWRIQIAERDVGLASKGIILAVVFYFLYWSKWTSQSPSGSSVASVSAVWALTQRAVQYGFLAYLALNIGAAFVFLGMRQVSFRLVQTTVFVIAAADGAFLAALILITGGLKSSLFWLYPVLILRNCISMAKALPQISLNALMCVFYAAAVLAEAFILDPDRAALLAGDDAGELGNAGGFPVPFGPFLLRIALLLAVAAWCYGLQLVLDRQRRRWEEQNELALRREQLQLSSRLAAEIAHQLKNPLAIINNASYTLQRTVKEGKTITQQIQIIREEVERSDRLITELMGYAKLADGRIERLNVREQLERAILQVFPPAVKYEVQIHREFADALPSLLAQQNHVLEIFINILQNAREAMNGRGNIWIRAAHGEANTIVVTLADDGPGIEPEHLERIFEPYFTTRDKGSGLGLAIVKHNMELYGGRVRVESELGKGTRFILEFPAKTLMRLRK
jgi:signal transduction histidine kinase